MCRESRCLSSFVLTLASFLMSSASAATIIWVSDNKGGGSTDQGWIDLLAGQGYDISLAFRNMEGRTLDATKLATLNSADLIIMSGDTASDKYNQTGEPEQWNGITRPILSLAPYQSRDTRWFWLATTAVDFGVQPSLEVVTLNHPSSRA